MRYSIPSLGFAGLVLSLVGCSPPTVARQPSSPSVPMCTSRMPTNQIFVVGMEGTQRFALRNGLKYYLAVFADGPSGLRRLPDCRASSNGQPYEDPAKNEAYQAPPQLTHCAFDNTQSIAARVPFWAASVEGGTTQSANESLTYLIVREYESVRPPVSLSGEGCAGATHYVSAFSAGAFELSTHAGDATSGRASALGAGAEGATSERVVSRDSSGNVAACEANPTLPYCDGVVAFELRPLPPEVMPVPPSAPLSTPPTQIAAADPTPVVPATSPEPTPLPPPKPEPVVPPATPLSVPMTIASPQTEKEPGWIPNQRLWGWVGLGVGAMGVGLGTTTGIMAVSRQSKLKDDCPDNVCIGQANRVDTFNTLLTLTTVGFVVGGVGAAVGTTLLLTIPGEKNRIGLVLSPGQATLEGSF
jgi:hypothetical protein